MNRKVQVRFLGDKGGVTRLSYPTTQGVKKQPRLQDFDNIKCSLKGIENKKMPGWHLFPVVVTADYR